MFDTQDIVTIDSRLIAAIIRQYVPYSLGHTILVDKRVIPCPPRRKSELIVIQNLCHANFAIFRMFGSPKELWKDVSKFINFQGNLQFLNFNVYSLYYHSRKFYHEMYSNKVFVCKNDFFLIIQNWIISKRTTLNSQIPMSVLSIFLKFQEQKLNGYCEYVEYNEEEEHKLYAEIDNLVRNLNLNIIIHVPKPSYNQEQLCESLASLLAGDVPRDQMGSIFYMVKAQLENPQYVNNQIALMESYCTTMITHLRKILDARPKWFLPFHEQAVEAAVPLRRSPRVFIDKGNCLVDDKDLKDVLNGTQLSLEHNTDQRILHDLDAVTEMLELPGCIHYNLIMIPVLRSKRSAVPIPTGNNSFCKFSADVLFEHLRDLFFGLRVFQTISEERRNNLIEYFEELTTTFQPTSNSVYQLDETEIEKISRAAVEKFGSQKSSKTIRNVPHKGFSLPDLIDELKLLELDCYFPDITDHAKFAYMRIMYKKKGVFLRTCDMFDAIEICLMIKVFENFPKMAEFVHNQRSCYRVCGLECEKCMKGDNQEYELLMNSTNGEEGDVSSVTLESVPTQEHFHQKCSEPSASEAKINIIECSKSCEKARQKLKKLTKKLSEMEEAINFMEDKERESQENIKLMKRKLKDQETTHQESKNQMKENEEKLNDEFNEVVKTLNSMSVKEKTTREKIKSMQRQLDEREKKHHESVKRIEEQLKVSHRQELARIALQHEDKERTNQELIAILSQASISTSNSTIQTTGSIFLELTKVKASHQKENPFIKAKSMFNKLILLSEDEEIKSQAIDELATITTQLPEYVMQMEKNIEAIQENPNIPPSELEKMPEYPRFSKKFMEEYERISESSQLSSLSSVKDCVICLSEIESSDDTTIKCQTCTQMLHVKCATPWITEHSTCPTCRDRLLHPLEYPPL